jgi:hypothetical protein
LALGVFSALSALSALNAHADSLSPLRGTAVDQLVNDNRGSLDTSRFTQTQASIVAFGDNIVIGFNDSGSLHGKMTGFAYSTDGGMTFTDGGELPPMFDGDGGDAVLARNETTGRIYFCTQGFSHAEILVFRSDTNGLSWSLPINAAPGVFAAAEKPWLTVDNFPGPGNGNVYLAVRTYVLPNAICLFRSTDHGATFEPSRGAEVVAYHNGSYDVVGPDHSLYVFSLEVPLLEVQKSTDHGVSFTSSVTVASDLYGTEYYGDLGLTGLRHGTGTFDNFPSNSWPHAAINPISGHIYVTYNKKGAGSDKADIFMTMSTDGGATWSSSIRINDDATLTDQWMPTIAATAAGDRVGIFYYSRQEDIAGNNLFRYFGRIGVISGDTVVFEPSRAISDIPSYPEFGRDPGAGVGRYNTASATDGVFHVAWADNRSDLINGWPRKDPNVYYDQIVVETAGVPEGSSSSPLAVQLAPAAPNPFQRSTALAFTQSGEGEVRLEIYSPTGALVQTLAHRPGGAGRHEVVWNGNASNGRPLPAGVYFVRLTAGSQTAQGRIVKLP